MVAMLPTRHHRLAAGIVASAALLPLGGCSLTSDEYLLVWLLVPLLTFLGAGLLFVSSSRSRQLAGWDLGREPSDPGVHGIVTRVVWTAVAAFTVFAGYNLYLRNMDWSLRLINIGLWLLGSLVGVYLACFLGLRMAERGLAHDTGVHTDRSSRRS